jgi:ubiquitin carboxyl-terminal hydrolase 6/32
MVARLTTNANTVHCRSLQAYCSKCKDFRVQTKRMSLWRLPPVVIIQLKRFQFTQHMRRKLRDFVVFPVEGLDLSRIMAADDGVKPGSELNDKSTIAKESTEATEESDEEKPSDEKQSENGDASVMSEESAGSPLNSQDNGRTEMLYDLYGVVHHQGALSGGHYVASLKSELDGQWRLFNDAQVYEIHNKDVVDSSAYILFYIRRDVANAKLSDFWNTSAREGEGLTEEDMDKLIRGRSDRCVIS